MAESMPVELTPPTEAERAYAWLAHAVGSKFGILLIALVVLLLAAPLIVEGPVWKVLFALSASVLLLVSLQAARPGRRSLQIGLVLAAIDLGIGLLVSLAAVRWLVVVQSVLWLATLSYVTVAILDAVFTRPAVDVETLEAALCVYLLLGLVFVYVYALIALAAPGSFHSLGVPHVAWTDDRSRRVEFLRLLVFSFSTLTTTGFGNLTPRYNFASICANLEAMTAQVYLAVVIARLVGLQVAVRSR
jgi:hypothetical protein